MRGPRLFGVLGSALLLAAVIVSPSSVATAATAAIDTEGTAGSYRPADKGGIKDAYVVMLADQQQPKKGEGQSVDEVAASLLQKYPGKLTAAFEHAFRGFAVEMTDDVAKALSQDPAVGYVEQQREVLLFGEQTDAPWTLGSLDQRSGLDAIYRWDTDGTGVHVYIVDSGIRRTHVDFDGRASGDVSFVSGPAEADCHGHGTAMAGAAGGRRHGVAKNVRLHAVRVFGCAPPLSSVPVLAGLDWIAANATRPAVVNLSMGTLASDVVDAAVTNLIGRGITVVAAAGNEDDDACRYSPGRVPEVITVGAVHALRDRLEFSNWGSCVDLFAYGEQVPTTSHMSDTATTLSGGTSIAAALVSGAVARYLERFPTAAPQEVAVALVDEATKDRITDHRGSPNMILYLDRHGPGNDGFGRTGSDVDGDGRDDIVTFIRGARADVYVARSTGSGFGPGEKWHEYFGAGNELPMLGDVDGDGRDDLITFTRGAGADVFVARSTGSSFGPSQKWHDWFAYGNESPVVGDFNGDGRDDIATVTRGVRGDHSVNRRVYVATSNGSQFVGTAVVWTTEFPGSDAIPLVGDFNCDGRDDLAALDRLTGRVLVSVSTGSGFGLFSLWTHGFGFGTKTPVVGDFNGDSCDDLAEFSGGAWPSVRVALSTPISTPWSTHSFLPASTWHSAFAWGTDVPGAGDFNGDGRDDVIAFTRGAHADVYVTTSTGTAFRSEVRKWHDWFAYGWEIPMPASLW